MLYASASAWQYRLMREKRPFRSAGERVRVGRRTISVPSVRSLTDADRPTEASEPVAAAERQPPITRDAVQYLDRVRAVFRPAPSRRLGPGLERFIGTEDVFRHVGDAPMESECPGPMMQCPSHWSSDAIRVPICDLDILEILEDQDVRAG